MDVVPDSSEFACGDIESTYFPKAYIAIINITVIKMMLSHPERLSFFFHNEDKLWRQMKSRVHILYIWLTSSAPFDVKSD